MRDNLEGLTSKNFYDPWPNTHVLLAKLMGRRFKVVRDGLNKREPGKQMLFLLLTFVLGLYKICKEIIIYAVFLGLMLLMSIYDISC